MWMNNLWDLGRAISIEQIFAKTWCHLSMPLQFLVQGMVERISLKRFYRCGGSDIFIVNFYINHPRRTFQVGQL